MQQGQQSKELKKLIGKSKIIRQTEFQTIYQYPFNQKTGEEAFEKYKTIIFIGQTGSGKTTLINFLLNYYLEVQYDDNFRFIVNEETGSTAISQTQDVTIHYIKPFKKKFGLILIDTPGFGDSRGIEQDIIIAKKLGECFKNSVQSFTSICFLVQASNARLTPNQNYILSSILTLFGNDVVENFSFIFTFSDGTEAPAMEAIQFKGDGTNPASAVADLIDRIKEPRYFQFNNSAIFTKSKKDRYNKLHWEDAMDNFENLYNKKISLNTDVSIQLTKDVIKERERMKLVITDLRVQIQVLLDKQTYYQGLINQVASLDKQALETENFKVETTRFEIKKFDIPQGQYISNCIICNHTCHYPCGIADDNKKEGCSAMRKGFCVVCEKRCSWQAHRNFSFRFETIEIKEEVEIKELKEKYTQFNSQLTEKEQILNTLHEEYEKENLKNMQKQKELLESIQLLTKIALLPAVSDSQEQYVDIIIKQEELKQDFGYKERIETLKKIKLDWQTVGQLQKNEGNFKLTREFYDKNFKFRKRERAKTATYRR